ncbi:MAG: hypothetical protein ASARMPREDX12_005592 [Alectoria sarmentosa]|nr:MAG: hypothetical protein ASARMPREDX12_005592 [Alectoria sarmentosa]
MLVLLSVIGILIAPFYLIYKPPAFLLRYFQWRWPDVLWRVSASSKIVALTIDDGPSVYTHEIMQILNLNGVTATFFVIGSQVAGHEKTLQDLIESGNELGNHAMHDEPSRSLGDATLVDQIHSVEGMIHEAYTAVDAEPPPKYFRPGSGFFSGRMRKILGRLGYRLVLGSIYPHDPQIPFWRINASHILSMLQPGGIMICHDRRSWTAPMLRKVLPEIQRKGYRIITVTELLKEARPLHWDEDIPPKLRKAKTFWVGPIDLYVWNSSRNDTGQAASSSAPAQAVASTALAQAASPSEDGRPSPMTEDDYEEADIA